MCAAAKKRFRNSRPGNCSSCGKWIKCDMYRHVATYHLDLGQLWRCPVSWYTVWKGTPQDCTDHVRGAHDVPWDIKSASLEKFFPPWTVERQIWTDSLKPCHSGVSTDILLFSDINLSLAHHCRVFKRGLPHISFRKHYLACLRVFVSTALAQCDMASPVPPSSVSARHDRSSEVESESPRKTRRARRRMRPTRVRDEPVGVEFPTLTAQDIPDLAGAIIYDCRPPLLPVSLRLKDIGLLPRYRPVALASLAASPPEDPMVIGSASPAGVAVWELGVAPPDDYGTDLEDELPTPEDSMVIGGASPERVAIPELGVAPPDDSETDLEDELLNISPLPTVVWPLTEPVEALPMPHQDELPTPEDSMVIGGASPERVAIPELGVAPPDDSETDLEDELLNISPLPTVVWPLTEPVEALPVPHLCIRSHRFRLSRTLSPVSSCRMFHSGKRTNVRRLTCFRHS